ncbi:MAG: glycosyltransferase family 39 protein [Candidatus Anstonellales archaeon]
MKITLEKIILVGLVAIYLIILLPHLGQLKTLPSPLYGGDYYHQMGQIYHMYETSPFEWFGSSNGLGERPGYFPIYGILVTIFGKIFGLEPFYAMIYFNIIALPVSAVAIFLLINKIFKNESICLTGVLLYLTTYSFPIFKYTEFTKWVVVPVFFYFLYKFYEKTEMKNAIFLGLAYGVMGLSHSTAFIFATLATVAIGAYILWKNKEINAAITENKKNIFAALVLGFVISQIYWFEPIFIYHGNNELKSNIWSLPDYGNLDYMVRTAVEMFVDVFLNFNTLIDGIRSLAIIFGFYVILSKKAWIENEFIIIVLVVSLALTYSYFLTMPLMDIHLVPGYCADLYLKFSALLIGMVGVKEVFEKYGQNKIITYSAIAILMLLSIIQMAEIVKNKENEQWFSVGKDELPVYVEEMQKWVLKNTNINDVILTSNEIGFEVNALTGRKLVVSRRAQNDAFMQDFDRRQMDAAIILYGNNDEKRKELLRKYNVKYVYYEATWPGSEFYFDETGKLTGYFDPLMVVYSEEKENELKRYGVKYFRIRGWLDPAVRGIDVRMYDLLIVSPENYDDGGYGIWSDELDKYLEKVWSYEQNGILYGAMYRVNMG